MNNKLITDRQKKTLFQSVLGLFTGLIAWIIVWSNITPKEEAKDFVVKNVEWTTKVVENIKDHYIFYLVSLGLVYLGYRLVYKRRRRY